jgi:uncharacterized glyoxalase superfamily protein PhnB
MSDETRNESCERPYPISVHLSVESVKKSIKFYRDKLGFTLRQCYPDEKRPVWASLVLGGQSVMVGACPTPEMAKEMGASKDEVQRCKKELKAFEKHPHGVGVAVYLEVADVDALHRSCKKKRLPLVTPLESHFYGLRDFTLEDPDGYRLVFYTSVATPQPATDAAPEPPVAAASPAPGLMTS